MRFHLLLSLLVVTCCSGCGSKGDARLEGTYTLDSTATMEFLKSSGNFNDETLAGFQRSMNRPMQLTFTSDRATTVIEGVGVSRKYSVVDKSADHVTIESESTQEEVQLGAPEPKYRIEFTDDGFWRTGIGTESVREKFVKQD